MTTVKKLHTKGLPPTDDPVAGPAIEARLAADKAKNEADHAAARPADPARLRASDVGGCARKIAFGSLGVPKDITYDAATLMTFRAGDFYHQITQEALVATLDARCEVDFDLRPKMNLWGKADATYERDGRRVVVEIKSQAGYGFDLATGERRSDEGPGPKKDHLLQVGFAAFSQQIQASAVHVVYVNKDRGTVAEWILGVEDELPHLEGATIRQLVNEEAKRLKAILADLDADTLPARLVPGYGLVDHDPPMPGSRDKPWNCAYCPWQPTCCEMPAEAVKFALDVDKRVVVL